MSRALDSDTAASLRSGDPLAAYQAISNIFVSQADSLLEIEILGKGHILSEGRYVLQDGGAVGVSKLGLVQAFMVARQYLRSHLDGQSHRSDEDVLAMTAVILLFDPEYLTAANTRKRLLERQRSSSGDARARLEREKRFVDSLLTSRLHRHTKSPTLWSHRRWLLTTFNSACIPVDVLRDIRDVVFVAGERHPRNYYAWCHARFLTGLDRSTNRPNLLAAVQRWCLQHHTDTSGWSFLFFLLDSGRQSSAEAGCSTFTDVLDVVSSLRLANESVWVFLRAVASSRLVGDEQYSRFLDVQAALLDTSHTPTDQSVLRAAVEWCKIYRRSQTQPADVEAHSC